MKKLLWRPLFAGFLLIAVSPLAAQSLKLESGTLEFLKGEKSLNVEYAYWNLYGAYFLLFSREQGLRQAYEAWKLNKARFDVGGVTVVLAALGFLVASVAGKLAGVQLAGRLLAWRKGEAWVVGWLLQTKALIMIIFVNVLLDRAIISASLFSSLLLMAVASTVLTIPMVRKMANTFSSDQS